MQAGAPQLSQSCFRTEVQMTHIQKNWDYDHYSVIKGLVANPGLLVVNIKLWKKRPRVF